MYSYFDYIQSQMPRYQSHNIDVDTAKIINSIKQSQSTNTTNTIPSLSPLTQTGTNHVARRIVNQVAGGNLQLPITVANVLNQQHPLPFQHTPSVSPIELSPDHYLVQQNLRDTTVKSSVITKQATRGKKTKDVEGKSKRIRTCYTPYQLKVMEESFASQIYLVNESRINLATELNLTETQVKVWFQNRRIKQRKLDAIAESKKLTSSQ